MLDGITQLLSSFADIFSLITGILSNLFDSLISFIDFSLVSVQFLGTLQPGFSIGGILGTGITLGIAGIVLRIVVDLL